MRVRFNSAQATEYRDGAAVNKAPALSQVSGAQIEMAWVEPTYHADISAWTDWLPEKDHIQYSAWNPRPRNG